jgi:hypothetical protein
VCVFLSSSLYSWVCRVLVSTRLPVPVSLSILQRLTASMCMPMSICVCNYICVYVYVGYVLINARLSVCVLVFASAYFNVGVCLCVTVCLSLYVCRSIQGSYIVYLAICVAYMLLVAYCQCPVSLILAPLFARPEEYESCCKLGVLAMLRQSKRGGRQADTWNEGMLFNPHMCTSMQFTEQT